jgi:hypothetical protein
MGDARLFYHSSSGEDMKSAVDLTGRAYARLPIAFMHRKSRVLGCGCRPEPWSVEAQIRHDGYAIAEGVTVRGAVVAGGSSRGFGTLTVVAGNYAAAPTTGHEGDEAPEANAEFNSNADANDSAPKQDNAPSQDGAALAGEKTADAERTTPQTTLPKSAATGGGRPAAPKQKQIRRQVAAPVSTTKSPAVVAAARSKATRMASAAPAGSKLVWPGDPR